jgi:DNA-binding MarR family transcriptional regulator
MDTNSKLGESLRLCMAIAKAHATLSRRFDGRLGTWHGLSFGDLIVLLHVGRAPDGRLRRVDLAAQLGVTASAVTRTLIPLEKIGLVARRPDPHDARVGYAVLTRAGQRVLQEALESAEMISREVVPNDSGQLANLHKLLTAMSAG